MHAEQESDDDPRSGGQRGPDRLGRRLHPRADQRLQPSRIALALTSASSTARRPDWPMMSVSTEASLRLASSRVFWMRWTWLACSRTSCLRVRSRVAHRPGSGLGHEAGADQAVGEQVESQTASATSVLRPGTFLTWAALARIRVAAVGRRGPARPGASRCGRLHGDMGAGVLVEPGGEVEQSGRGGGKRTHLTLNLAALGQTDGCDDGCPCEHRGRRSAGVEASITISLPSVRRRRLP